MKPAEWITSLRSLNGPFGAGDFVVIDDRGIVVVVVVAGDCMVGVRGGSGVCGNVDSVNAEVDGGRFKLSGGCSEVNGCNVGANDGTVGVNCGNIEVEFGSFWVDCGRIVVDDDTDVMGCGTFEVDCDSFKMGKSCLDNGGASPSPLSDV